MMSSENIENYPFDEYICGVTGLTCCGYCDKCPNNPSNGGSGICNCILGQPHIT